MEKRHIPWLSRMAGKKNAGTAAAALAVGLVLLALLIGAAIGRYQTQFKSDAAVRAKEFYFTSDFLDGSTYTLTAPTPLPAGAPAGSTASTEVSFTLGNHADELRCSEVDIDYTVTVEPADGVSVDYEKDPQKLGKDVKQDDKVTIRGLQAGKEYTVTATGKGGYEETLTATIKVLSSEAQIYQHQETVPGEYSLLTVWNEGETAGTVRITYTGIPDNTNPNMTDWLAGGPQSPEVEIGPHESKVFRFFGGAGDAHVTGKIPN